MLSADMLALRVAEPPADLISERDLSRIWEGRRFPATPTRNTPVIAPLQRTRAHPGACR
jgi:hypothetical protein